MYKQYFLIAALIICSSFISSDEIENKVMKAAQDDLAFSLSKIPEGKENLYGFANRDEFKSCTIGKPYHVITLNSDFFNEEEIQSGKNYIVEKNEWRVPVLVNGENRLLLTVVSQPEGYHVADLGGVQLAKELQQKSESFSMLNNRYMLRIYPLTSDFLVKATSGSLTDARYIPLTSALMGIKTLKDNHQNEYSLNEILYAIKQELKDQSKN